MSVSIRFVEPRDAVDIVAIYGPSCESTPISFEVRPPTTDEITARIERIATQYPWLVCEIDGRVSGYVYASRHRERAAYAWSIDVAVYTASFCLRRGVGRGLYTSLLELLRLQGIYKAYAGITLPNDASVGLHEAFGFKPIGVYHGVGYKLGRWHDVGWWELSLQPVRRDPSPPQPIQAIRDSEAAHAALAEGAKLIRP